jgi:Fe-Mn family superoxide dismutase
MGEGGAAGDMKTLIERDFGGMDAWTKEMTAAGIAARGWVVTAYDRRADRLFNYCCDAHNLGCVWDAAPLVVLDVYEHAYYLDYATARKTYIEAFFANLTFNYANTELAKLGQV